MTGIAFVCGIFAGCQSVKPNQGDAMVAQLRVSMTKEEVRKVLGTDRVINEFRIPSDLYIFLSEVVPYDLASRIPDRTETWTYGYWVNSNTQNTVNVFFGQDNRVIGWAKQHSDFSAEKYSHEKLTSQLKHGMTERRVKELIGSPQRVTVRSNERSREIYSDHYWTDDPVVKKVKDWPMWVYTYSLPSGNTRHVYLIFDFNNKLLGWGYDHAHEEAERYLREQGTSSSAVTTVPRVSSPTKIIDSIWTV